MWGACRKGDLVSRLLIILGSIFKDTEFEFCISCTVVFANRFYVDWISGVTRLYWRRMNKTHIFFIYIQGYLWQLVQCLQMCWFNRRNLVWLHVASAINWISCNTRAAGLLARFSRMGKFRTTAFSSCLLVSITLVVLKVNMLKIICVFFLYSWFRSSWLCINKIQQDATLCRYLFTASLLYTFWASIATIIRNTINCSCSPWYRSLQRYYDLYQRLQLQFIVLMMGAMDAQNM